MDVKHSIYERRALRSLAPVEITEDLINDLAESAKLAPSCYNKQPWNFVFVYDPAMLEKMRTALSKGNKWAYDASLMIAVFSKEKLDCIVKDREYYLFDTGMATAFILLRATELGLVTHPIAGYDEDKAKEILHIPEEMQLITIVMVGGKSDEVNPDLPDWAKEKELKRPPRKDNEEFIHWNKYEENE